MKNETLQTECKLTNLVFAILYRIGIYRFRPKMFINLLDHCVVSTQCASWLMVNRMIEDSLILTISWKCKITTHSLYFRHLGYYTIEYQCMEMCLFWFVLWYKNTVCKLSGNYCEKKLELSAQNADIIDLFPSHCRANMKMLLKINCSLWVRKLSNSGSSMTGYHFL